MWNLNGPQVVKTMLKKNKVCCFKLPDFNISEPQVIKIVWYWQKDRRTDQWNKLESPEISLMYSLYGKMTFDKDAKTIQWKRTVSSTIGVRKTVYQLAKEWRWTLPYSTQYIKNNSKQIKHLNVRPKTGKLIGENTGEKLHDIGFANDFLDVSPKAQKTNQKYTNETTSKLKVPCIQGHN